MLLLVHGFAAGGNQGKKTDRGRHSICTRRWDKSSNACRKERGLTQESLAERLGVTFQAVSKWETDAGMPDVSQIVPLANAFGVRTDVLFGLEGRDEGGKCRKSSEARIGLSTAQTTGTAAALLSGAAGGAEALPLSAGAAFAGAGGRRIAGLSRKRVL